MSAFLLGLGFRADMGTCIRKLVVLKMIDACEDDGTRIFPAIATIARAAQCSPRQAQREVKAFLEIGLLRLVRAGGNGPRSTNEYAMDLDLLAEIARDGWDAVAARRGDISADKGDTQSPLDEADKGDSGDAGRVTPETDKGDNGCHPTPPEPSMDPSRVRAAAREGEGDCLPDDQEGLEAAETPGRAEFEKRVMRFCSGRGFHAGPWPDWDTGAAPRWIAKQFAGLSIEERAEAERWRDAYLADISARKQKPVAVGNFLSGRLWTGLDPAILERAEKQRQGRLATGEVARPDGWAACLGPVGMAWLFDQMLKGPKDAAAMAKPFLSDSQLRDAWPELWWFQALLRQRGGAVFDAAWHAMKPAMERVLKGSAVLAAWREEFAARGWKWLPAFDGMDVVYCPKGGPDGLVVFEHAVSVARAGIGKGRDDDGRQAAE